MGQKAALSGEQYARLKNEEKITQEKAYRWICRWGRQLIVIRNTRMDADTFQDAFIIEAIEDNGCYCSGSLSDDKIDVIVEFGKMSGNPENKFARVTAWLDERSDIEGWRAGPLFDLWYGDYEDIDDQS